MLKKTTFISFYITGVYICIAIYRSTLLLFSLISNKDKINNSNKNYPSIKIIQMIIRKGIIQNIKMIQKTNKYQKETIQIKSE